MLITFMKKLKHLVSTLIQRLKRKQKTSQLSDTDNNLKFSKGDQVIIIDGLKNFGFVKNTTGRVIKSEIGQKEPIYIVELYGSELRFPESSLIHQNPDDERDWKLNTIFHNYPMKFLK